MITQRAGPPRNARRRQHHGRCGLDPDGPLRRGRRRAYGRLHGRIRRHGRDQSRTQPSWIYPCGLSPAQIRS